MHRGEGVSSMKKPLVLLALVALVAAGFAQWVSLAVEAVHRDWIAQLGRQPGVRVLTSELDRGWLESEGEVGFELRGVPSVLFAAPLAWAGREGVRSRVGFVVHQRIEHGPLCLLDWLRQGAVGPPVIARIELTVEFDHEAQAELAAAFGRVAPLHAQLAVRVTGEADGPLDMPAVALRPQDVEAGAAPRWVGRLGVLQGHARWSRGGWSLDLAGEGLALAGPEIDLQIRGWQGRWVRTAGSARGEHGIAHASLVVRDAEARQRSLQLDDLHWTLDHAPEELGIDLLARTGRWNAQTFEDLRLGARWARELPPVKAQAPDASFAARMGLVSEIELDTLRLRVPEGPLEASGRLVFENAPEGSAGLQGDLLLTVPRTWGNRLLSVGEPGAGEPEPADAWLAEGWLTRDRTGLRTRLQWNADEVLANGRPIPTEPWWPQLASQPIATPPTPTAGEPLARAGQPPDRVGQRPDRTAGRSAAGAGERPERDVGANEAMPPSSLEARGSEPTRGPSLRRTETAPGSAHAPPPAAPLD